ncbi:MAG: CHAT domain-containing tetratricopeptide repeat protein [Chloroflexota bacterium]
MITPEALVDELLALPDEAEGQVWIDRNVTLLDNQFATKLKEKANQSINYDIEICFLIVKWLSYLATLTHNQSFEALSLFVKGNAYTLALGEYKEAVIFYDEAAAIYDRLENTVEKARIQVTRVWALANLGRYEEAFKVGQWAGEVLEASAEWLSLAILNMNLAICHARQGKDVQALAMFDKSLVAYQNLGEAGLNSLAQVHQNRGIILRNLGHFEASLEAIQNSWELHNQLGNHISATRALQNIGVTYFVLGRYNEALDHLDRARQGFLSNERHRDAILVDLFISDCLLQLRRFDDVLEKCEQVREGFAALGTRFEVGQALLNEATAYAGQGKPAKSLSSLTEARQIFQDEENVIWLAVTDLERASVLYQHQNYSDSLSSIQDCIAVFQENQLPVKETLARLTMARSALKLNQAQLATEQIEAALTMVEETNIPTLRYQAYHLQGALLEVEKDYNQAIQSYDQAIDTLEGLRGQVMVEYRADFVGDKAVIYEDIVRLCLDQNLPERSLDYVERAKSRSLIDLLAFRLDLSVQARTPDDEHLVRELVQLRAERDRLYRRWEVEEGPSLRGNAISADTDQVSTPQDVEGLEKRITEIWHTLLIRNADYAREAALWQVRTEPIQPYLDDETMLIEYFLVREKLVVFCVTTNEVKAVWLPGSLKQIQTLLNFLHLNFKNVPASSLDRIPNLTRQALGILQKLYNLLLAPLGEVIKTYKHLMIVPHRDLHYLPFHALHDQKAYLLEKKSVSYLPSGSFLRYCQEVKSIGEDIIILGHSYDGHLPYATQEAEAIAECWGVNPYIGTLATLEQVQATAQNCKLLHLATHGDFRPDNPLFSGLALADSWLTTLDIFNLPLNASLVTLSACQTGRNVVGGGDELLGLMRAFLSAGASSLVLSHWAVEDQSTAQLMRIFYQNLNEGQTKIDALRNAQNSFITQSIMLGSILREAYAHPYFWASFYLVGATGPL